VDQIKTDMQLPSGGKVVGIVARLHPSKGHATFLKAARLISQAMPQTRFAIVGDGPSRSDLEDLTQELGITSKVTFFGNQREVGSFFSAFDITCLCSTDLEGCSNSILEAMALGKPVVATDVGGNREIVQQDETGLLVPCQNYQALFNTVTQCLNQPDWAQAIGRRAQEVVFTRFSQERMVHEYQSLYEDVIKNRGINK
jgi:glycosyltransferase involved in cell wall biosynthesis